MSSITLKGECTIYEIGQIHQQIHDKWKQDSELSLNVSAVTDADASFIQLLASCRKTAEDKGQAFKLVKPTEALIQKIEAMFMSAAFSSEKKAN